MEIPRAACRGLGLDNDRHWLRFDELNRFVWPGYDLRPIPERGGDHAYGLLPQDLFERARQGILARQRSGRVDVSPRDRGSRLGPVDR